MASSNIELLNEKKNMELKDVVERLQIIEEKNVEFRKDMNIIAQHIVALRNNLDNKVASLAESCDIGDKATKDFLGVLVKKLEAGEVDVFTAMIRTMINDDSVEERKKLFEDIQRYIDSRIGSDKKANSNSGFNVLITTVKYLVNIGMILAICYLFYRGRM
ncbi:hypothetical protein ACOTVD_09065 [Campylobacter jejuni]|uniref:hypothetical protein n=1 Tax=Campylobacter jejuni TaxID=197 RepID=UPI003B9CB61F